MWSAHKCAASPWQQGRENTGSNNRVWKQSTRTRNLSQAKEREGERLSWRELQLPVSIAMRCRAAAHRGRGSVRGWNRGKCWGGDSEKEQRMGCPETSVYSEDERREVQEWRGDLLRTLRCGRDTEIWHGSPRLATGDCHPQGHLESAQESPPCQEFLHGGSFKVEELCGWTQRWKQRGQYLIDEQKNNEAVWSIQKKNFTRDTF